MTDITNIIKTKQQAVSPVVYKTTKEWEFVSKIFERHFSEKKALYHYNSITKNHLRRYFEDKSEVKYKPYLYNLRQRIDEYISSVVSEVEKYLEIAVEKKQSDWDELNSIFLQLLEKVC